MNRQLAGHRYLRDLPSSAHGQVEELAAPMRLTAHRDLRRFHQQEPQQRVALFADVSQASPIPARFLRRNQARHSWRFACHNRNVLECQSPTRRPTPSVHPDSGMRHQSPCDGPLLHFPLERSRQVVDLRSQLVEYVEQVSAASECPRSKH